MKQEGSVTENIMSGLLRDAAFNMDTLELFAGLYLCEKLRQDLTEKAASRMGGEMAKGFRSILKGDSLMPETVQLENEIKQEIKKEIKKEKTA